MKSKFKKTIKTYCPPVFLTFILKVKSKYIFAEWEYIGIDWDDPKINKGGWNLNSIVQTQVNKWNSFCSQIKSPKSLAINHEDPNMEQNDLNAHNLLISFCYVCALSVNQQKIKILDWGGGLGHYGIIAIESLPNVDVSYFCYDLPVFKSSIESVFPEAKFIQNIKEIASHKFDLINISSSLWYDPNWQTTLSTLSKSANNYLYITRMIFVNNSKSFLVIQRPSAVYKTKYFCQIFNKNELVDFTLALGFKLIKEFYFGKAPEILNAPEQGYLGGFLFKKILI